MRFCHLADCDIHLQFCFAGAPRSEHMDGRVRKGDISSFQKVLTRDLHCNPAAGAGLRGLDVRNLRRRVGCGARPGSGVPTGTSSRTGTNQNKERPQGRKPESARITASPTRQTQKSQQNNKTGKDICRLLLLTIQFYSHPLCILERLETSCAITCPALPF